MLNRRVGYMPEDTKVTKFRDSDREGWSWYHIDGTGSVNLYKNEWVS